MTQPDVFSALFWRATVNHMLNGGASTALSVMAISGIGQLDKDANISAPGWSVAVAFGVGTLLGLLYSLIGQALPLTGMASMLPPAPSSAAAKPARKRAPAKKRPPAKKQTPPSGAPSDKR